MARDEDSGGVPNVGSVVTLFEHLVGAAENRDREDEPERQGAPRERGAVAVGEVAR